MLAYSVSPVWPIVLPILETYYILSWSGCLELIGIFISKKDNSLEDSVNEKLSGVLGLSPLSHLPVNPNAISPLACMSAMLKQAEIEEDRFYEDHKQPGRPIALEKFGFDPGAYLRLCGLPARQAGKP